MSNREGRITPEDITELKENEIFVFGSNEGGIQAAGAAKTAKDKFDAEEGKGWGPTGRCFAFPTKNWDMTGTLTIPALECYAGRFMEYVMQNPGKKFLVTKIGCGLAGYEVKDIAPLFAPLESFSNVSLPKEFWDVIDGIYLEELITTMMIEDDGAKNELSDV